MEKLLCDLNPPSALGARLPGVADTCTPDARPAFSWSSDCSGALLLAPRADLCFGTVFLWLLSTEKNLKNLL